MGFRFRKSIKILPGMRVNVSSSGVSTTFGGRGASVTVGKRGSHVRTSLPGTGVSYGQRIGAGASTGAGNVAGCGCLGCFGGFFVLIAMATCVGSSLPDAPTPPPVLSAYDTGASTTADELYIHESINVRSDPDKGSSLVRTLPRGSSVRLGPKDANGWAPLYDDAGQRVGYVYRASKAVRSYPAREPAAEAPSVSRSSSYESGGGSSSESSGYYIGPRGGCYTYSSSGRKRYVDHSYCN